MLANFLQFILYTSLFHSLSTVAAGAKPLAPALFVFGDSLLDTGNNNLLPTVGRANYYPYGVDFAGGSTGRFSNGKNVADFIAEYLGLPYPPHVVNIPIPDSYTGYNYASGACGILDQTGSMAGKCLNLKDQVNAFNYTIESVLRRRYEKNNDLYHYLSKSIFIFSVGNNDYIADYLIPIFNTSKRYDPQQYSELLIDHLSDQLQVLYNLGARKVLLFELGPIGCTPSEARTTKHKGLICNEDINRKVSLFNDGLGLLVSNLNSILPHASFVLAEANSIGYDAVINPSKYGLTNSRDPCCATFFDVLTCIPGLPPCKMPNKHYFWDAFHPTEAVFSALASNCINGSICKPNIQQLIQD